MPTQTWDENTLSGKTHYGKIPAGVEICELLNRSGSSTSISVNTRLRQILIMKTENFMSLFVLLPLCFSFWYLLHIFCTYLWYIIYMFVQDLHTSATRHFSYQIWYLPVSSSLHCLPLLPSGTWGRGRRGSEVREQTVKGRTFMVRPSSQNGDTAHSSWSTPRKVLMWSCSRNI